MSYNLIESYGALCLLLMAGKYLRVKIVLLQRLYLPAAVVGGLLGLIVLNITKLIGAVNFINYLTQTWGTIPGELINVVFASLFLGVSIPSLAIIWRRSAPQLAFGQIVAWGQYMVGLGLVIVLLMPLFGINPLFGVVIPVGFEGGHGTAAGLTDTFNRLNWSAGKDLCLASATVGIISAILIGMGLINWAARKGYAKQVTPFKNYSAEEAAGFYPIDSRPSLGKQTVHADSIDTVALHLALLGLAILLGYVIQTGLSWLESQIPFMNTPGQTLHILRNFPLFPLAMLAGIIMQLCISRFAKTNPIDHQIMQRLGGTALDFLVIAAISTIRLDVITSEILPFTLIALSGILWNVFCVTWLSRRVLPNFWFERAIVEMGQSMGVTATGLLLLRVVDPEQNTPVPSAFAYKQLLHEPIMGGGLWTASAIILVSIYGPVPIFVVSVTVIAIWMAIALWLKYLYANE